MLEAARKLLRVVQPTSCKGVASTLTHGLPPGDRPEVAFAGRSNVGKSSLINALLPAAKPWPALIRRTRQAPAKSTISISARASSISSTCQASATPRSLGPRPRPVDGPHPPTISRGRATLRRVFLLIDSAVAASCRADDRRHGPARHLRRELSDRPHKDRQDQTERSWTPLEAGVQDHPHAGQAPSRPPRNRRPHLFPKGLRHAQISGPKLSRLPGIGGGRCYCQPWTITSRRSKPSRHAGRCSSGPTRRNDLASWSLTREPVTMYGNRMSYATPDHHGLARRGRRHISPPCGALERHLSTADGEIKSMHTLRNLSRAWPRRPSCSSISIIETRQDRRLSPVSAWKPAPQVRIPPRPGMPLRKPTASPACGPFGDYKLDRQQRLHTAQSRSDVFRLMRKPS